VITNRQPNATSLCVHLDKSFLREGKFCEIHLRILDGSCMPIHSAYHVGSGVLTNFRIGVLYCSCKISKSEGSNLSFVKNPYYCSRCKMYGHNKRTCTVINPGMTTEKKENSSYGTTYLGSDISIFSSTIFKNATEFNADEFKSILECHSFETQNFLHESIQVKNIHSFEYDVFDILSFSSGLISTISYK